MKVLITGGAGFIGSHLAKALDKIDHEVTCLDNLENGNWENLEGTSDRLSTVQVDVRDKIVMDRLADWADVVVHLAAVVGVAQVVSHPVRTIEANVNGTELVLQACQRYNTDLLLASTSEIYGNQENELEEESPSLLGPTTHSRWCYAVSKLVDEHLALAYKREYNLHVKIMRFFNIVGPRQTSRYGLVMPKFVEAALKNENIIVYGDGSQSRTFCHVDDCVRAIIILMNAESDYQVFNIGRTKEITMFDLAKEVKSVLASRSMISFLPYEEAYEKGFEDIHRRVPRIDRMNELGWYPQKDLFEIIMDTASFVQFSREFT